MNYFDFDEWFGIFDQGRGEFLPGKLRYGENSGLKLEVICQSGAFSETTRSLLEKETICGFLDYQRPTTLYNNFVSKTNYGTMSANTRYMRTKYNVTSNGMLKNFHLNALSDKCFLKTRITSDSFKAWYAERLIEYILDFSGEEISQEINISPRKSLTISLSNGFAADINIWPNVVEDKGDEELQLNENLSIDIRSDVPIDLGSIQKIESNLDFLFGFLVGSRLRSRPTHIETTSEVTWNNEQQKIIAESWQQPAWKREKKPPREGERIFIRKNTPVSLINLLELCISNDNRDLFYFMNMVQAHEMNDLRIDDCFIEILGCLEDTDINVNGRKIGRRKLTLRDRLFRLIQTWRADDFHGNPDLNKIVQLRNLKPHGRGKDYKPEDFEYIIHILPFLAALLRYHTLKRIGFDRDSIADGFTRSINRYGMFAPDDRRRRYKR